MKNVKAHIYSLLTGESSITDLVEDRIHFMTDDLQQEKFEDKFPLITYYSIGGSAPVRSVKRIVRFQISCRAETNLAADEVAGKVISLLKDRTDTFMNNCFLVGQGVDISDPELGVSGVALTFDVILKDQMYS